MKDIVSKINESGSSFSEQVLFMMRLLRRDHITVMNITIHNL